MNTPRANGENDGSSGPADQRLVVAATGCAGGIGCHVAGRLIADGHRVLATALDLSELEKQAKALGWNRDHVELGVLDVRRPDQWRQTIQRAVERWGRLDVLLNIAGIVRPGHLHQATDDDIAAHMDINAKGVMFGTRAAAAQMVSQKSGHIINVASMAGIAPVPGISLYTASKFAVRGFSLAVAQELRPHGVFVTVICPDAVQTPMLDLELEYEEAALVFSAPRVLSVSDVERAIRKALVRRPLEIIIPRSRGWVAKTACVMPSIVSSLLPKLTRKGLKRQAAAKARLAGRRSEPPSP